VRSNTIARSSSKPAARYREFAIKRLWAGYL
jgi:hypothetical protein